MINRGAKNLNYIFLSKSPDCLSSLIVHDHNNYLVYLLKCMLLNHFPGNFN